MRWARSRCDSLLWSSRLRAMPFWLVPIPRACSRFSMTIRWPGWCGEKTFYVLDHRSQSLLCRARARIRFISDADCLWTQRAFIKRNRGDRRTRPQSRRPVAMGSGCRIHDVRRECALNSSGYVQGWYDAPPQAINRCDRERSGHCLVWKTAGAAFAQGFYADILCRLRAIPWRYSIRDAWRALGNERWERRHRQGGAEHAPRRYYRAARLVRQPCISAMRASFDGSGEGTMPSIVPLASAGRDGCISCSLNPESSRTSICSVES